MRFRIEQRFAGSVEEVEAALVDPAFLERLGTLPNLGSPQLIDQTVDADTVRQRVRYRFTGEVSAAVRRVVDPKRLSWVEESTLVRATHRTTWRIVPDHYPGMIRCSGTFQLAPDGEGSRRIADADIRVHVPLVGGKVERAIVSGLEEHAAAQEPVVDEWLLRRP